MGSISLIREWLTGLALLPALICGGMMFGGAALAALGLRRATAIDNPTSPTSTDARTPENDRVPQQPAR